MFPYSEQISQYTAAFPASVYTPRDVRNMEPDGVELVETGGVPPSLGSGQRLRLNLDQVPMEQAGMTVEVAGSPRTMIPYGEEPGPGEVAVSMTTGVMEFHESDADLPVTVSYRGKGTPIMAHLFHQLGRELAAVQQAVADGEFTAPVWTNRNQDIASTSPFDLLKLGVDASDSYGIAGAPALLQGQREGSWLWLIANLFGNGLASTAGERLSLLLRELRAQTVRSDGVAELHAGWLGPVPQSVPSSSPYFLTSADSGKTFFSPHNFGSSQFQFYLPQWAPGLRYRFVRQHTSGNLRVFSNTGNNEYIAYASSPQAEGTVTITSQFGAIEIEALPAKFEWDFGAQWAWVVRDASL